MTPAYYAMNYDRKSVYNIEPTGVSPVKKSTSVTKGWDCKLAKTYLTTSRLKLHQ